MKQQAAANTAQPSGARPGVPGHSRLVCQPTDILSATNILSTTEPKTTIMQRNFYLKARNATCDITNEQRKNCACTECEWILEETREAWNDFLRQEASGDIDERDLHPTID